MKRSDQLPGLSHDEADRPSGSMLCRTFDRNVITTRSSLCQQIMDEWLGTACGQIQGRHRDGQIETAWPSTSRIKMEHPTNDLDPGPMRVAEHDDVHPARCRIELQRL